MKSHDTVPLELQIFNFIRPGHSNGAPECVPLPGHGGSALKDEDFTKEYYS